MMGTNEARVAGTCGVWLAVMVVAVGAIVTAKVLGGVLVFLIVAILAGVAAAATQAIWGASSQGSTAQNSEKSKRRSRVDRMLERMDDAELDELRARLMSESDGEAVSLNELLAERERRSR
jgi:hypothetical protein